MLQFPAWKVILITLVVFFGGLMALPNLLSDRFMGVEPKEPPETASFQEYEAYRQDLAEAEAAWWPGIFPSSKLNLGLDLRGGVYLLMEIDPDKVVENRLDIFESDATTALRRQPRITRVMGEVEDGVLPIRISNPEQVQDAIDRLNGINEPVPGAIGGQRMFQYDRIGTDTVGVSISLAAREALTKDALRKTIEIVRRRLDPGGVSEISIAPQGTNRIVLEAPGEADPTRIKSVLSRAGRLTFNLARYDQIAIQTGNIPPGYRVLDGDETGPILVENTSLLTGADIRTANQGYDERNRPNIEFSLNSRGAQRFGEATSENVGQIFAIVLDDSVMSAPRINEPIFGGNVQITGSFTMEEAQDLAAVIEAGELPAQIGFIEERTVGPTLGEDSIRAGVRASLIGLALVAVFMILSYGLIGGFAVTSLAANILMIIGVLSGLGATLTLPGIAGIILTIGMAVDANVVVFERVREEREAGRSPVTAIQTGYERALSAILDANVTTFIAAAVLYMLGSGPVKGFAVTLAIGIFTSVFTAFVLTRWFMALWLRTVRPKKLPI